MTDHKVAIGIISLFRPNGLRAALESLVDIIIPDGCELILLVVDNDQLASAKPVFDQVSASLKFQCCYFIERLRGIPFARNRVVEEALKLGCSEIAFFDDDEIVSRDWLKKLFEFYRDQSCDIATGPVSPIFPAATPAWRCRIETERFFRPRNLSTGAVIPDVFTHNVIYSSRIFSKLGMRFNEKLATSGDRILFCPRRLAAGDVS